MATPVGSKLRRFSPPVAGTIASVATTRVSTLSVGRSEDECAIGSDIRDDVTDRTPRDRCQAIAVGNCTPTDLDRLRTVALGDEDVA